MDKILEELEKAYKDSIIALEEARAGREVSNIPQSDTYWFILNKHRAAYQNLKTHNG